MYPKDKFSLDTYPDVEAISITLGAPNQRGPRYLLGGCPDSEHFSCLFKHSKGNLWIKVPSSCSRTLWLISQQKVQSKTNLIRSTPGNTFLELSASFCIEIPVPTLTNKPDRPVRNSNHKESTMYFINVSYKGKTLVKTNGAMAVEDLKMVLQKMIDIALDRHQPCYDGLILAKERTMDYYGIWSKSTVSLVTTNPAHEHV